MMGSKTNEIIEEIFKSLLKRYQEGLEESMRGSYFTFDSVDVLYYDLNRISLSTSGLYIDSPEWLKNKKATINPKNKDYKCFESNNKSIALNILYVPYNTEEIKIRHAYSSKKRENQVIFLMITDDKKRHYLAVKNCVHYLKE